MFRSMRPSVAGFALVWLTLCPALTGSPAQAAVPSGGLISLPATGTAAVRCEWQSAASLDATSSTGALRVARDEDGLLVVTDRDHPNAPLTPHLQAPLATAWIAIAP